MREHAPDGVVDTVATFLFSDQPTTDLRGKCLIPNLAMHVFELQQDPKMKRKMSRGIFAQLETDPMLEQRYWAQRRAEQQASQPLRIPRPPSSSGSTPPPPRPNP